MKYNDLYLGVEDEVFIPSIIICQELRTTHNDHLFINLATRRL